MLLFMNCLLIIYEIYTNKISVFTRIIYHISMSSDTYKFVIKGFIASFTTSDVYLMYNEIIHNTTKVMLVSNA